MRKALNENPTVQIAVVGVLVLVVGLFFMMTMKKKPASTSSAEPAASGATPAAGTTTPVTVPGAAVPAGGAVSDVGASVTPPVSGGTVAPDALVPGPGLPRNLVRAWKAGDAIVLLIVREHAVDDRLVKSSVESLSGGPHLATFIAPAEHVARYSRITQGVGVSQVPALVVVRPRRESGSIPQAQVSYGFRDSKSVVQAVHDALYTGRDSLPYYPR